MCLVFAAIALFIFGSPAWALFWVAMHFFFSED